jgi:predicted ATPase/DNA-binding winged helix-turn-helix (wHTH) protein
MSDQAFREFSFGHCEVLPERRELRRDGKAISLGNRAFDILLSLAVSRGRVISKDELIAMVWPGRIIEENSLESQVSLLRRALGADRAAIRTIAGRGYQLISDTFNSREDASTAQIVNLPASISRLIGRERALDQLEDAAKTCRLITLVGAAGIGKTRLAIELARRLAERAFECVRIADLASVSQSEFVPMVIASTLGLASCGKESWLKTISSHLEQKRVLLVLDNCEHLIDASAGAVDALLRSCPFLQVIATSREALRVEGEYVYRVPSLDVPDPGNDDGIDVLRYSAIQLFEARLSRGLVPSDSRSIALKTKICRRLDGIPLAIELAAARVEVFGIAGVYDRLESLFEPLTTGSRTALPRQQTLSATLDWSYDLLPEKERTVLLGLSIFAGEFTLEAAISVLGVLAVPATVVVDSIVNLVYKSLVVPHTDDPEAKYKLLEMTRIYARRKLSDSPDLEGLSRLHANYVRRQLQAEDELG